MLGCFGRGWFYNEVMTEEIEETPGWEFWLIWTLGSTLAWGLSLGIFRLVSRPFGAELGRLSTPDLAFFGLMTGALIGIVQWLLLRFQGSLAQISWWIWASLLGWALGLSLADLITQPLESQFLETVLFGAILGAVVGSITGLLLRRVGVPMGWWLGANLLGFCLSWLAILFFNWLYWGPAIGFGLAGLALVLSLPRQEKSSNQQR